MLLGKLGQTQLKQQTAINNLHKAVKVCNSGIDLELIKKASKKTVTTGVGSEAVIDGVKSVSLDRKMHLL